MGAPTAGTVVLVPFPFSDLRRAKLRPATVLAVVELDDLILCQITSNPYGDPTAVPNRSSDFQDGGLQRDSFARPGKVFTANTSLLTAMAGRLVADKHREIVKAVVDLLHRGLTNA